MLRADRLRQGNEVRQGAAVIAVGGFLAPEVSERLKKRQEEAIQRGEADRVAHTALGWEAPG